MRRFFLDPARFDGRRAIIGGDDSRHIRKVLRMHPGQALELIDGAGALFLGRIEAIDGPDVVVAVEQKGAASALPVHLTLAQGYLKDEKMDLVVRQATELGIAQWQPFFASRSVPRPPAERMAGRIARWEKIAREAVKQSRRDICPRICGPVGYEEMLTLSAAADVKLLFWETGRGPFAMDGDLGPQARTLWIVVGPEGGLTDQEVESARCCGFRTAGLGPRILRAQTAALAACALVQYCFGDLGRRIDPEKRLDKSPPAK